ncbi:MAG: leucine-rich repeat protein [Paludibacteraceae bacterium]|nr:leucine-rich repeat protein [Paludibacteraceae bacterium]
MNKIYTTKTPSLKATIADIRNLDVKKMLLNGKNILEYIKENATNILDYRGTKASNLDIVSSNVTVDSEGNVIIDKYPRKAPAHFFIYYFPGGDTQCELQHIDNCTEEQAQTIRGAAKIENGEVFDEYGNHLMYWDTTGFNNGDYGNDYTYGAFINSKITSFKSDLSSLTNGQFSFGYSELAEFSGDLSKLERARCMFYNTNLTTFTSDLPKLTNGDSMFSDTNLTSFSSDLSNLTDGNYMFYYCIELTSFSSDLSSLTYGSGMFNSCSKLTTFECSDLHSLTNGNGMFSDTNLTSFSSDLSNLTNGSWMFYNCTNLESFTSNLSSLTNGSNMFDGCMLDTQSVTNILHFIPQRDAKPADKWDNGNILIGVGITNTDAAKQAFAEECYCDTWEELNDEFDDKNWVVQWQFNGDAATFDLRAEKPSTAVYTKLEEVFMPTEEEIAAAKEKGELIQIPHYEYTSQDGDNYYNIHWYHDSNTNNEGYDYFESLEMATLAYSVIPKA